MGQTLESIPFFVDSITIEPHTATKAKHIGRVVSIRQFANNKPVSLRRILETGELIAQTCNGDFIEGPEV